MTDAAAPAGGSGARVVALAVAAALLAVAIAWAGRAEEGRGALAESTAALDRGELDVAIQAARVAAEARCPTCDAPREGYAKLEAIARQAEAKGDDATAFAAFGAIRSAALATAAFGAGERRTQAETELARLGHKIDATAALAGGTASPAATEERLRAALATSNVPSGATFALVGAGAALFLTGALRLARSPALRGFDAVLAAAGVALAALALALF